MNFEDEKELEMRDSETIHLKSRRRSVSTKLKITNTVPRKTGLMAYHFLEGRANILIDSTFDPIAKIPEFKVCSVKIRKIDST